MNARRHSSILFAVVLLLATTVGCSPTSPSSSSGTKPTESSANQALDTCQHSSEELASKDRQVARPNIDRPQVRRLPPVAVCERLPSVDVGEKPARMVAHFDAAKIEPQSAAPLATAAAPRKSFSITKSLMMEPPPVMASTKPGPRLESYEPDRSLAASASVADRIAQLPRVTQQQIHSVELPPAVKRQAHDLLRQARELADRGALYAARDEFSKVLRLITQALDAGLGRPLHTPALAMGIRALEEADDFAISDKHVESDVHLEGLIAGHKTPVLKRVDTTHLTPLLAIQQYYEFAYRHLALAGNRQVVASDALFSLGRIEMMINESSQNSSNGTPKAIAFFNAALTVNADNSRAANELGVLLARKGRWEEASEVLEHAAHAAPTQVVMRNLSEVQRRLGRTVAANQTMQLATRTHSYRQPASGGPQNQVQFVDPQTFVSLSTGSVKNRSTMNGAPLEPLPMTRPQTPTGNPVHVANRPEKKGTWFGF